MAERADYYPDTDVPVASWLGDAAFINAAGTAISQSKVTSNELIGLYFSASWCPPCQRFLPKLIEFYTHLKEIGKPFEVVYISSDYTEEDMLKYMKEKEVPWVAVKYDHPAADRLRKEFGIEAVPAFTIVTSAGVRVENNAKKDVDTASASSSSSVELFNTWKEKIPKSMGSDMSHDDAKMECKCGKVPCQCKMGAEHGTDFSCGDEACEKRSEMQCKCEKVPCQCKMGAEMQCKCGKVPCQCKMGAEMQCKCGKVPCQCKMDAEVMSHGMDCSCGDEACGKSDSKMECKCGKVPCQCNMGAEMQCKCGKVPCQCKMDSEMQCKCGKVPCQCKMGAEMQCKCGKVPCQCKMDAEMQCKCGKVPCQCKMGAEMQCKCGKVPCECKMADSMPTEQELSEYRQMAGTLFKQGIKGPTRNQFRKRYFKFEQGNRLAYYKANGDATPKGYIDLKRVTEVFEVPRAQQDKNRATFRVICEGRTYNIQAETEAIMKKWVIAIRSLARTSSTRNGATP